MIVWIIRQTNGFDSFILDDKVVQINEPFELLAPYGIRESTERIGTKKSEPIPEELLPTHVPSKLQYGLGDIYKDLLNFAAEKLVMNGRLVFWIPIIR